MKFYQAFNNYFSPTGIKSILLPVLEEKINDLALSELYHYTDLLFKKENLDLDIIYIFYSRYHSLILSASSRIHLERSSEEGKFAAWAEIGYLEDYLSQEVWFKNDFNPEGINLLLVTGTPIVRFSLMNNQFQELLSVYDQDDELYSFVAKMNETSLSRTTSQGIQWREIPCKVIFDEEFEESVLNYQELRRLFKEKFSNQ